MTGRRALALSDAVAVTLVPTYHWSARGAFDRRMALWCSYVIEARRHEDLPCRGHRLS